MKKLILAAALVVAALSPAAAQRAAAPAFPTEWQGNDKWCPQSDLPPKKVRRMSFFRSHHPDGGSLRAEETSLSLAFWP